MHLLVEHCQLLLHAHGGIYGALLVAGLVGSLTHCAGMCGPFVAAQTAARLEALPAQHMREWRRLQGAALLPYHAGRITTYMFLGALAGGFSSLLFASPYIAWLSAAMLAAAGILFLAKAWGMRLPAYESRSVQHALARMSAPLWKNPIGARGYALGIMLGFLPCGLVWAALMASATTGSSLAGAAGMSVFGLGTVPALFMVALGSHFALRYWPLRTRMLARGMMGMSGIVLCALAVERII